jgi:WD40 repeat protein
LELNAVLSDNKTVAFKATEFSSPDTQVFFTRDGGGLVTLDERGLLKRFTVKSGEKAKELTLKDSVGGMGITNRCLSEDLNHVIGITKSNELTIWKTRDGQSEGSVKLASIDALLTGDRIVKIWVERGYKILGTVDQGGVIRTFGTSNLELLDTMETGFGPFQSAHPIWTSGGQQMVMLDGSRIGVFDLNSHSLIDQWSQAAMEPTTNNSMNKRKDSVAVSADMNNSGTRLAIGFSDGIIRIYDRKAK